jgi:hypothetical protein
MPGGNRDRDMCSARTRRGTACMRKALDNGRCPNHRGLSTGPKTAEGRAQIAARQRERWQAWHQSRSSSNPEPPFFTNYAGPPTREEIQRIIEEADRAPAPV